MLFGALLTAARPVLFALAICVALELAVPRDRFTLRARLPGAILLFAMPIATVLLAQPLEALWRSFGIPPLIRLAWLPDWAAVLVLLLARDFCNYWMHRFDHAVMWPVHSMHHCQTELHAANGYAHPLQFLSEVLLITIPLSFMDVGAGLPYFVVLIVAVQAMIIHSPLTIHLGPLRRTIVDSRFHRIHHSREARHFGKNYGTVFSIWDQLFGTAYFPAADEWPEVGVDGIDPPRTMGRFLLHPFNQMRGRTASSV